MLEDGIIQESDSAWSSPMVLISKLDGSMRFCIDYRTLNAKTEGDQFPMPSIEYIISQLNGAKYLSSVDLCSGYWAIPIAPEDKKKTAFTCHRGLFEFNVMPFGLKTAPSTFNRMMSIVLKPVIGKKAFTYLDDVIIFSKTFKQHLLDLEEVFSLLESDNLWIKIKKCQFCSNQFKFLGKIVKDGRIEIDPAKTLAIEQFVVPKNSKAVQKFLGLTGWLRNHVKNFARISRPLVNLTKKTNKFIWDKDCQQAFDNLKLKLVTEGVALTLPDFEKKFIVETDASGEALGAILSQLDENGATKIIEYASRLLHETEINYTVTEKECLAIVWAVKKFRGYISDAKFTIKTDHSALKWLLHTKDLTGRLTRWALRLQEYDYTIEYTKGKDNLIPDALSRGSTLNEEIDIDMERMIPPSSIALTEISINWSFLESAQQLMEAQDKEDWIKKIRDNLMNNINTRELKNYILINEVVCYVKRNKLNKKRDEILNQRNPRPIIPRNLIPNILKEFHDDPIAGHCGRDKTLGKIANRVFWPKMTLDIKEYVKTCRLCQTSKATNKILTPPMTPTQVSKPMEMIGIDLMGPYPRSKRLNKFLLVFTDYYSKWVEIFPLKNSNTNIIAKHLIDMFCRYGVPEKILSDNGPQFLSKVYSNMCKIWRIKQIHTMKYHPQSNATERQNQNIKKLIRIFIDHDQSEWDRLIPQFAMALRTTTNNTTGFSPAKLFLQRELKMPWDNINIVKNNNTIPNSIRERIIKADEELQIIRDIVKEHANKQQKAQKEYYDKKTKIREFKQGDTVKIKNFILSDATKHFSNKLAKPWTGPLFIKNKINDVVYEIEDEKGKSKGKYNIKNIDDFKTRENITIEEKKREDPLMMEHQHPYGTRSKQKKKDKE